jgi:hypothetical protein
MFWTIDVVDFRKASLSEPQNVASSFLGHCLASTQAVCAIELSLRAPLLAPYGRSDCVRLPTARYER